MGGIEVKLLIGANILYGEKQPNSIKPCRIDQCVNVNFRAEIELCFLVAGRSEVVSCV